jgi:NAD(P)-dependent dehydrogenase (short-subunit alcohol dehydrogenase family)
MKKTIPPLPSPAEFAGRAALVTGGSEGLGRHLVRALVCLGAEVFFCARDRAKGRALAKALGRGAHFVRCDLADVKEAAAFVRKAGALRGRIDYLVNNAAMDPRIPFGRARAEDFDHLVAVNLRPCFVVSQAALPYLRAGEGKAIVNICTTNYMLGLSPFTIYNASKSGIIGFTRSLARELGPLGIRVNAVSPGWIMTEKQLREHVSPKDKRELLAAQALKFLLAEEHVTPATLFLLSSAASGITGQNLVVDGGKVMQ